MLLRISSLFLAAVLVSTAAYAGEEALKDKNDPSRVICKRVTPIGSILSQKVCHTAAEWAQMGKNAPSSARNRDGIDSTTRIPAGGL
jgi:hypothetical protein